MYSNSLTRAQNFMFYKKQITTHSQFNIVIIFYYYHFNFNLAV